MQVKAHGEGAARLSGERIEAAQVAAVHREIEVPPVGQAKTAHVSVVARFDPDVAVGLPAVA